MISDCYVNLEKMVDTPDMYQGSVYAVPETGYSLKITYQYCDAPQITGNFATMEVRKDGVLIATRNFYAGGDPALFDNNSLCIALGWMSCVSSDPTGWWTGYRVWYNPQPCAGIICPDICVGNDLYSQKCNPVDRSCVLDALKSTNAPECLATHFLDIKIKPHSWYSPGGAADWLALHLVEINGKLFNVFKDVTDYQYLGVSIFTNAEGYVVIRTYLKSLSVMSMSPGVPVLAALADIVIIILAIVIVVGIIVGIYLITNTLQKLFGKDYTKGEVGDLLNDILTRGDAECSAAFPADPVGYANCMKALTKAVTGAGSDFFKDAALKTAGDEAAAKIDACVVAYNLDLDKAKLEACVKGAVEAAKEAVSKTAKKEEECWITSPTGGCILSAKTGKIIVGGAIGLAVLYVAVKLLITRKK